MTRNIVKKYFKNVRGQPKTKSGHTAPAEETSSHKRSNSDSSAHKRKYPYFIQIGFDFGTSYSKCVCRDMMANRAWVHFHPGSEDYELPFLIPSTLLLQNGLIVHLEHPGTHYPENGLYHLKHALVKTAQGAWDDPVLGPFHSASQTTDLKKLSLFVEACAVYFLAGALGEIRENVRQRFPGFGMHPQDYMAVNLAIPVGDSELPEVNKLFRQILYEAWCLADQLSGHPHIHLTDLELLRRENQAKVSGLLREACFIYPEVSANVQGFVRSRVSSPGIYLFSDTGGGTVDQSVFIFMREDQGEHLTYLTGRVLPLGSSHIERRAAENDGAIDSQSLEKWRERKERGEIDVELKEAKNWIAQRLKRRTESTLALAKQKLFVKAQMNGIRVIFGGGGDCEHPYRNAAMKPFSGQLFQNTLSPDVIGLPLPRDMELKSHESRWMRRLSVAYGLSFEKSELARFTYPKDVSTPSPDEIWQPPKPTGHAPSKDEC